MHLRAQQLWEIGQERFILPKTATVEVPDILSTFEAFLNVSVRASPYG
jgi:hypothetical protein